jgi:hypothetical protein
MYLVLQVGKSGGGGMKGKGGMNGGASKGGGGEEGHGCLPSTINSCQLTNIVCPPLKP